LYRLLFSQVVCIRQNCFAAEQLPNPWEDKYDVHPARLLIAGVAGDEDLMNS
jgi:hypothetical protein